jgi:deoxyuridine 5'-triphosphate nucleotidohydrolase
MNPAVQIKLENPLLLELREKEGLPGLLSPATDGSAGYDVQSCLDRTIEIHPGEQFLFPLGFSIQLPSRYWEMQIRSRSGLGAKEGLVVAQGTGTIDSDYTKQVFAMMFNRWPQGARNKSVIVEPGDRIAQVIFAQVGHPDFETVKSFSRETSRAGGFGSTGR